MCGLDTGRWSGSDDRGEAQNRKSRRADPVYAGARHSSWARAADEDDRSVDRWVALTPGTKLQGQIAGSGREYITKTSPHTLCGRGGG